MPTFLIKEVRQSLRSRRFVRSFIGLQLLLQIFTIIAVLQSGSLLSPADNPFVDMQESTVNKLFWLAVGAPILLIPPISILAGMGRLFKDRSLELVLLTRLTAGRAVLGMWLSYMAEGLLLTLASVPYVVLRYYLGGVDMFTEMILFGVLLALSAMICAMALGLSTYRSLLARVIILLLCGGLGFLVWVLFLNLTGFFDITFFLNWRWAVLVFCILPTWAAIFLILAANRLCPPGESHSGTFRLAILLLLVLCFIIQPGSTGPSLFFVLMFATPLLTECLCDPFRAIRPLYYAEATRFPTFRRIWGRVFYPGWAAGLNFVLLFYLLFAAMSVIGLKLEESWTSGSYGYYPEEAYYFPLRLLCGHALTLLGAHFFFRVRWSLLEPSQEYFGVVFVLQLLFSLVVGVGSNMGLEIEELMYVAPIAGSIRTMWDYGQDGPVFIAYLLYPLLAVLAYWLTRALAQPQWQAIRSLEHGETPPPDARVLPPSLIQAPSNIG